MPLRPRATRESQNKNSSLSPWQREPRKRRRKTKTALSKQSNCATLALIHSPRVVRMYPVSKNPLHPVVRSSNISLPPTNSHYSQNIHKNGIGAKVECETQNRTAHTDTIQANASTLSERLNENADAIAVFSFFALRLTSASVSVRLRICELSSPAAHIPCAFLYSPSLFLFCTYLLCISLIFF